MHEPKNREATELSFLEIRVDHADGSASTDPNGVVGCVIWATEGRPPVQRDGTPIDLPGIYNPLELKPLYGQESVISGEPAVVYRADDLVIPLTPTELLRFMAHSLRPDEFFKLRERYGDFFEIHDDFYDPDTGLAFQPMIDEMSDDDGPTFRKMGL